MCTQINAYCVYKVHNSTVVGRGGGGSQGLSYYFPNFQQFTYSKRCQVIICLKLKIRIMSCVTMLKLNIYYKRCFVKYKKSCLKRLKLLALYFYALPSSNSSRSHFCFTWILHSFNFLNPSHMFWVFSLIIFLYSLNLFSKHILYV